MRSKQWKNVLPAIWSSGSVLLFSAVFFLLYGQSRYLLFLLSGIFLLLLSSVNLILLLFGRELSAPAENGGGEAEEGKHILRLLRAVLRGLTRIGRRIFRPVQGILLAILLIGGSIWFGIMLSTVQTADALAYWHLATVIVIFLLSIIVDKLCKHAEVEDPLVAMLLRNARTFFALSRGVSLLLIATIVLRVLNIYDICQYIVYAIAFLFYYSVVMIALSLAARMIKKEIATSPGIVIFLPFLGGDIKELEVLSFLEENTGITLRSLWSIRFIKSILPYTVVLAALLLWLSTGLVYVQSHQEAAVYRFGHLQEETLSPGLHLTFPWLIDKTEIHDTETIRKVTVGYKADENVDNVWTEAHGDSEYKLLLGSGNELVSINLRVEYRISDLKQYLSLSASPDKILEAKAYELILSRTINTDLESILSTNRETFAKSLEAELSEAVESVDMGLEVVSVIMESIHPPVEVAEVYQAFIGAEIDAEEMILTAQGSASHIVASAESGANMAINNATVDYYNKIAAAQVEISEFMAAVEASEAFPDEYTYYKYLDAICTAYSGSKLIILGDGVDGTRIYYGDFSQ